MWLIFQSPGFKRNNKYTQNPNITMYMMILFLLADTELEILTGHRRTGSAGQPDRKLIKVQSPQCTARVQLNGIFGYFAMLVFTKTV